VGESYPLLTAFVGFFQTLLCVKKVDHAVQSIINNFPVAADHRDRLPATEVHKIHVRSPVGPEIRRESVTHHMPSKLRDPDFLRSNSQRLFYFNRGDNDGIGIGFTGLGFIVAWSVESTAGYHAIMSVFMLPLWMLSGALFPLEGAATWLAWIMRLNPVTYALILIRQAFYQPLGILVNNAEFVQALWITLLWAVISVAGSVWMISRKG
jgi:hypothetical protein